MYQRLPAEVVNDYAGRWLDLPGVVGVAVDEDQGEPCIKVYVAERAEQIAAEIPQMVEGYRVVIEETGPFYAI